MRRWGLTIPLPGVRLAEHRELIGSLPDLGYTDAWTAETAGADAFSPLALAAEWAPQLRLGTAVVPVYTRGPGLLAMSAASIADLAPGRFVFGIGTSSPAIVEGWNAASFTEPMARTRDTVEFLRRAFSGEKVTERYETFEVDRFRLETVPAQPPPVMLAALRPGMLRLGAERADGIITNWLAATDVPRVRSVVGAGVELAARIFVCPTGDTETARGIGRRMISSYLTVPAYRKFHEWLGRGESLEPMHRHWAAGDRKAANEAIPDSVVDELLLHGPAEYCREQIQAYVEHGLDTPIIAMVPTGADPSELVRGLAPAGMS